MTVNGTNNQPIQFSFKAQSLWLFGRPKSPPGYLPDCTEGISSLSEAKMSELDTMVEIGLWPVCYTCTHLSFSTVVVLMLSSCPPVLLSCSFVSLSSGDLERSNQGNITDNSLQYMYIVQLYNARCMVKPKRH